MPARLTIESVEPHATLVAFDARGRALTLNQGRVAIDGKAIATPKFTEGRWEACGDRFVFVGHPWEDRTPATVRVLGGDGKPPSYRLPRTRDGHLLAAWLDDDRLALVVSDAFHVVHGVAIGETTLGRTTKAATVRKVRQLRRHIGRGHAELSLQSVLRRGDRWFALASAGYRHCALLELEPTAKSFGSRVLAHAKADQAVFSASGEHAVFYERNKTTAIVGLDGTKLATVTVPKGKYRWLYLISAAPQKLVFGAAGKGPGYTTIVATTSAWPAGARAGALAPVPASARIADLPVETAQRCSPEPIAYAGAKLPIAWGAVIGWALNADAKKQPITSHAIVTDLIVNFFAVTEGRLRFLFNFDLSAIVDVALVAQRKHTVVTIHTPSGRTVLHATPAFAAALAAAAKQRKRKR